MGKVLVLFPPTTKHLGLLEDINNRDDVILFEVGYKNVSRISNIIRKVHLSQKVNNIIQLPNKSIWFKEIPIDLLCNHGIDSILIIDGALNYVSISLLRTIKESYPSINIILLLINSLEADSPSIVVVKNSIFQFPWDQVLTFDPEDAKRYKFVYKGFCYYSKHNISENTSFMSDVSFYGGLKGGRKDLILDTYHHLTSKGILCDFNIMTYGSRVPESTPGLKYLPAGWRPYKEVLSAVSSNRCILEILQSGQAGASLRYFEAVCYNRKLLSNNPHIIDFPYYDPRYMRIFHNPDEIDIEWVKSDEPVDYKYRGDFSPNLLIDYIYNHSV